MTAAEALSVAEALSPALVKPPRWQVAAANWPVAILAAMMLLVPALGVPGELMLQDTLKSALMAFGPMFAPLLLFGQWSN